MTKLPYFPGLNKLQPCQKNWHDWWKRNSSSGGFERYIQVYLLKCEKPKIPSTVSPELGVQDVTQDFIWKSAQHYPTSTRIEYFYKDWRRPRIIRKNIHLPPGVHYRASRFSHILEEPIPSSRVYWLTHCTQNFEWWQIVVFDPFIPSCF